MPWTKIPQLAETKPTDISESSRMASYVDALLEAQRQALETDPAVIIMGEGIDDAGGCFGSTKGLAEQFGPRRIFDLPLAENGCMGMAIGSAMMGMRPIVVHMRVDFTPMAMDQIINHAAKWCYMFNGQQRVPVVVRCVIGRGWGSGAQHSQSLQGLFQHIPGLRVVMPATAHDAKGMLLEALVCNGPVLFLEHRWLYNQQGNVPEVMYRVPFGKAAVIRTGHHITLAALSYMVVEAQAAATELAAEGIETEVLNMRSVKPMDYDTLSQSVAKTGRLVIADTGNTMGGWSAEVAAFAAEALFDKLKAPVQRIGLPDIPTPAGHILEQAFFPNKDSLIAAVRKTLSR